MLDAQTEPILEENGDDRSKSLNTNGSHIPCHRAFSPSKRSDRDLEGRIESTELEDGKIVRSKVESPVDRDGNDGENEETGLEPALTSASTRTPVHSIFTQNQKRYIVFMTAWAGFFSPVSANIYYPALNSLARDLHVSDSLINLTITSYMIFQGLAPTVFGDLADSTGRRPAYLIGFSIYLCANVGLALQNNYAALMVLRCVQSSGSSATIAIAYGIVADISTSAERGSYTGIVTAGMMLGPSLGPVIGGVLSEFLGWRAIFWFLTIMCAVFMVPFLITFPETSRQVVGDGSIPPQGWNMSLLNYLQLRKQSRIDAENSLTRSISQEQEYRARANLTAKRKTPWPNPMHIVHIILEKEVGLLLAYNSIMYIAFMDIAASLPFIFTANYHYNDLQIGLCFLPFGIGSSSAAFINGRILDRNFRRTARKLGLSTSRRHQLDLRNFPIEKARLQIMFPMLYLGIACLIAYGWVTEKNVHVAAPLTLLFFLGYFITGSFNISSTLLVDLNPQSPATATAANNLVRCLIGAGATALIVPMINAMGKGWSFTLIAGFVAVTSPMPMALWKWGPQWREEKRLRMEREEKEREVRDVETPPLDEEGGVCEKRIRDEEVEMSMGGK